MVGVWFGSYHKSIIVSTFIFYKQQLYIIDNEVLPGFGTTDRRKGINYLFQRLEAVRMAERSKAPHSRFVHLPMM